MNTKYIRAAILSVACLLFLVANATGQNTGTVPLAVKGALPEKIASGFSFTEGPAADREGNVFFTDQPNDRIMKYDISGKLSTFMQPSGRSNGMYFDSRGFLWTCADENNELWSVSPGGEVIRETGKFNGLPFNGPNDLWISPSGAVYFTDPFYKRSWWTHSEMPQDKQCVYLYSPENKSVVRVADDLVKPNGIIGTPDGKTLYVADIGDKKTWSYKVNADGSLGGKTLFCSMGSDGMTIDSKGNLYLSGNGVTVFDRTGKQLGNIPVPEKWTANVCFGGKDRKSLFITASEGLYRIKMKTRGVY
jgi:gluconolactonase